MEAAQSHPTPAGEVHKSRLPWSTIFIHATLIFFCMIVILPLLWVLLLSVKTLPDAYTGTFIPSEFDFTNYGHVFEAIPTLGINMGNSIFVTLTTVILVLACAVPAGYALVHLKVPGKFLFVLMLVGSLFFPSRLISNAMAALLTRMAGVLSRLSRTVSIPMCTIPAKATISRCSISRIPPRFRHWKS